VTASWLKPFRRPRLWLGVWVAAVLSVVALSLMPPAPLPELPSGGDKVEHFLAYGLLAMGAVQLFATRAAWLLLAVGLVAMGVGLEYAQGAYTDNRMQDPFDALANTLGVIAGLATAWTPLRDAWLRVERRFPRSARL
jgi:VanZ family protein